MDMDISMDIHAKSVDINMDMDGKFHIHGNPGYLRPRLYWYIYITVLFISHADDVTLILTVIKSIVIYMLMTSMLM